MNPSFAIREKKSDGNSSKSEGNSRKQVPRVTIAKGDKGLAHDELEVKVLLRGTPDAVIFALAHGLPRAALTAIHDALGEEMRRRKPSRAVSGRRTKP
jgi:hypothetical protein